MATGVVISGVGQSKIGRRVDRSGLQLTLDATLEALKDARDELIELGMAKGRSHHQAGDLLANRINDAIFEATND